MLANNSNQYETISYQSLIGMKSQIDQIIYGA